MEPLSYPMLGMAGGTEHMHEAKVMDSGAAIHACCEGVSSKRKDRFRGPRRNWGSRRGSGNGSNCQWF